jgi:hypothetical protein
LSSAATSRTRRTSSSPAGSRTSTGSTRSGRGACSSRMRGSTGTPTGSRGTAAVVRCRR